MDCKKIEEVIDKLVEGSGDFPSRSVVDEISHFLLMGFDFVPVESSVKSGDVRLDYERKGALGAVDKKDIEDEIVRIVGVDRFIRTRLFKTGDVRNEVYRLVIFISIFGK